eukprot:gene40904-64879_t
MLAPMPARLSDHGFVTRLRSKEEWCFPFGGRNLNIATKRNFLGQSGAMLFVTSCTALKPKPLLEGSTRMTLASNFDFLSGDWIIANRRLKDYKGPEWEEFSGSAKVWSAMDGMASIEELRGPNGKHLGMGIRVLNKQTGLWADHWTSAAYGV